MKRILLLAVVLMIFNVGICFAEDQNIYEKARDVADLYSDCVYLYKTSGLSYNQFDQMYTNATLQKNRFLSRNREVPTDLSNAMEDVDKTFADTRDMWKESIYSRSTGISKSPYQQYLFNRYPRMQSIKRSGLFGLYDTQQILQVLSTYCIEKNDKLQDVINDGSKNSSSINEIK